MKCNPNIRFIHTFPRIIPIYTMPSLGTLCSIHTELRLMSVRETREWEDESWIVSLNSSAWLHEFVSQKSPCQIYLNCNLQTSHSESGLRQTDYLYILSRGHCWVTQHGMYGRDLNAYCVSMLNQASISSAYLHFIRSPFKFFFFLIFFS